MDKLLQSLQEIYPRPNSEETGNEGFKPLPFCSNDIVSSLYYKAITHLLLIIGSGYKESHFLHTIEK
jgi:hypothetical protein